MSWNDHEEPRFRMEHPQRPTASGGTFLRVDIPTGLAWREIVIQVTEQPAKRGPSEWTPALVAEADRVARALLGNDLLVGDGDGPLRRYRVAGSPTGWRPLGPP